MKRSLDFAFAISAVTVLFPKLAWAYVDPGTGSVVFGATGYVLAAVGVALAFVWRFFKDNIVGLFKRREESRDRGRDHG